MDLRLNVLGPVEVWLGERRLEGVTPQMLTVLVILASEPGRTLSTADLAMRVWADKAPASALGGLRNHIHALRRQFDRCGYPGAGTRWLASARGGYRLTVPVATDVGIVEELIETAEYARRAGDSDEADKKLVAAKQLWRGDPLLGLPGPFVEKEQARLQRLRSALSEARIGVALDLGRYPVAVAESQALVTAEPYVERWRELLMLALYQAGRRAEALTVYRDARRVLVQELGLEPGPRLAELQREILSAELAPGPAPAMPAVPTQPLDAQPRDAQDSDAQDSDARGQRAGVLSSMQLPVDIADFVGREEVIGELTELLGTGHGRCPVIAITGMGGVGKTTLAIHVAYRVQEHYPDGVIYLDLGGMDGQSSTPATLLEVAFRAIRADSGELPRAPQERAALWRDTIKNKRILLVLDNAREVDQFTPLLPGPGTAAVIVTSRSSLTELFGARLIPLDALQPDEAWAFLERMTSPHRLAAEPQAAHAILRECGHLPLSLRIIGARLATRPAWRLDSLAERLADQRHRLTELTLGSTSIEAVFHTSYQRLDPELAHAFVLPAFSDAPDLPIDALAALLDQNQTDTERACETLVDLGMLQTPEYGRYRYHDLLRAFARHVATPTQQQWPQALHRLADYYLATAKNIVTLHDLGIDTNAYYAATERPGKRFTNQLQGATWAITERFGLLAFFRQAAEQDDARIRTLAVDLALALIVCWDGERVDSMARSLEALGRSAEADGDRRTLGRAQLFAGMARGIGAGDLNAERALGHAGTVLREAEDWPSVVLAEYLLGIVMVHRREPEAAIEHLKRSLELGRQVGYLLWEGLGSATIAGAYGSAGRWQEAVEAGNQALVSARRTGDLRVESMALHELGFATLRLGDAETARELCERAVEIARRDGRMRQQGMALARLADVLLRIGDAAGAIPVAAEALRALPEGLAEVYRLRATRLYGRALIATGRADEGEPILRKAEQLSRSLSLPA